MIWGHFVHTVQNIFFSFVALVDRPHCKKQLSTLYTASIEVFELLTFPDKPDVPLVHL
jgi:hypothetical protein